MQSKEILLTRGITKTPQIITKNKYIWTQRGRLIMRQNDAKRNDPFASILKAGLEVGVVEGLEEGVVRALLEVD